MNNVQQVLITVMCKAAAILLLLFSVDSGTAMSLEVGGHSALDDVIVIIGPTIFQP